MLPRGLFGSELDGAQLDTHFLQPDDETLLQALRRELPTAASSDERLDVLFETELAQARRALVEMLAHLVSRHVVDLTVEIEVDLFDHLGTVDLMRAATAH